MLVSLLIIIFVCHVAGTTETQKLAIEFVSIQFMR